MSLISKEVINKVKKMKAVSARKGKELWPLLVFLFLVSLLGGSSPVWGQLQKKLAWISKPRDSLPSARGKKRNSQEDKQLSATTTAQHSSTSTSTTNSTSASTSSSHNYPVPVQRPDRQKLGSGELRPKGKSL